MLALFLVPWLTIAGGSEPSWASAAAPATKATAGRPLQPPPVTPDSTSETLESPVGLANPASQFCGEQGYRLEIRKEPGGSVGDCLLPDGSECEESAFFRGECNPGRSPRAVRAKASPFEIPRR